MLLSLFVGQRHFARAVRRTAAAARFAQQTDELLTPRELRKGRVLLFARFDVEQPLGAGIGQHDFVELIDRDHGIN